MSLVGYIRVSTIGQKLEVQQDAMKAEKVDRVFEDKLSGTSMIGRKALTDCLEFMREGDTLVITKMDRLARSARDLYNIVHDLEKRGISIRVLDQGVDTSTPASLLSVIFLQVVSAMTASSKYRSKSGKVF